MIRAVLCSIVLVAVSGFQVCANDLQVVVSEKSNNKGNLLYAIFTPGQAFPTDYGRAIHTGFVSMGQDDDIIEFTIKGLTSGQYAIAVIHDENGNDKLDLGLFGIPVEGYGFSQNPFIESKLPSFEDSAFIISDATQTVEILLQY